MDNAEQRQKRDQADKVAPSREDQLVEAIWHGVHNSRWAKDPDDPNAEPSLGQYVRHVCDVSPRTVLKLMMQLYDRENKE